MRKYPQYLVLFLMTPLLFTCNNSEEKAEVDLLFTANFGTDPLVMYDRNYTYEENMNLRFQLFQFYISEVTLLKEADKDASGEEVLEVALVNFGDIQSDQAAEDGVLLTLKDIPVGNYKGIRFGIGIPETLNNSQPGDYAADHPLSGNYWSAASSYVFFKIEGNADLNGGSEFAEKLTFHVGTDQQFRELTFLQDFSVSEERLLSIPFEVDLEQVLVRSAADFLDFRETTQLHNGNTALATYLSENLANAIQLKN